VDQSVAATQAHLGDLPDPLLQVGVIGVAATIMVARSLRPKQPACPPYADLPRAANNGEELPPPIRPQRFRETTSCNSALPNDKSATRHLSVASSSSNRRRRRLNRRAGL
jgi:hypothetical protein